VDFGPLMAGRTACVDVTLSACGDLPLVVSSFEGTAWLTTDADLPAVVAAGASQAFEVCRTSQTAAADGGRIVFRSGEAALVDLSWVENTDTDGP